MKFVAIPNLLSGEIEWHIADDENDLLVPGPISNTSPASTTTNHDMVKAQDESYCHSAAAGIEIMRKMMYFSMLNDLDRNSKFFGALDHAVESFPHGQARILDIGTGNGLFAIYAANRFRDRIQSVVAFEQDDHMHALAQCLARYNQVGNDVKLVNSRSTLAYGHGVDGACPSNILITETLDSIALGEGILPIVRHARRELLDPCGPIHVIPFRLQIWASLFESETLGCMSTMDFLWRSLGDSGKGESTNWTTDPFECHIDSVPDLKMVTNPLLVFDMNLQSDSIPEGTVREIKEFTASNGGIVDAIVVWFRAYLDETDSRVLSTAPSVVGDSDAVVRDHWKQCVYLRLDAQRYRSQKSDPGDSLVLAAIHDDYSVRFESINKASESRSSRTQINKMAVNLLGRHYLFQRNTSDLALLYAKAVNRVLSECINSCTPVCFLDISDLSPLFEAVLQLESDFSTARLMRLICIQPQSSLVNLLEMIGHEYASKMLGIFSKSCEELCSSGDDALQLEPETALIVGGDAFYANLQGRDVFLSALRLCRVISCLKSHFSARSQVHFLVPRGIKIWVCGIQCPFLHSVRKVPADPSEFMQHQHLLDEVAKREMERQREQQRNVAGRWDYIALDNYEYSFSDSVLLSEFDPLEAEPKVYENVDLNVTLEHTHGFLVWMSTTYDFGDGCEQTVYTSSPHCKSPGATYTLYYLDAPVHLGDCRVMNVLSSMNMLTGFLDITFCRGVQ